MISMSAADSPSRRMLSTIPFGDTPASNSKRPLRVRPSRSCTRAENPGSATSASGTPGDGLTCADTRGSAAGERLGPVDARDRILIDQQRIGQVVDQDRQRYAVYGLELDLGHRRSVTGTPAILAASVGRCVFVGRLVSRFGNSVAPRVVTGGCCARTQEPTRSRATRGWRRWRSQWQDDAQRRQGPLDCHPIDESGH